MATIPNPAKSRTWDLGTSANGTFFDTEFNQLYANDNDLDARVETLEASGIKTAIIENRQTSGTGGGALGASGSWVKNPLNTIVSDPDSIVTSLSSNVITLPAGTYRFEWASLTYQVDEVQSRLRNTADSISYLGTTLFGGTTANLPSTGFTEPVTIAGAKTFELQANASTNYGANDFGRASSRGVGEVYSRLVIQKIA